MHRMAWQAPLAVAIAMLATVAIGPSVATAPAIALAAFAPELARVDLVERRLPNRMVVPGLAVGAVAAAGSWLATGRTPWIPVVAALVVGGVLLLLALAGGVGMGDVKLAAFIGLASPTLGIAVVAPVAAFLLGGLVSVVVLVRRGAGTRIPFGPFLLVGYLVALAATVVTRA